MMVDSADAKWVSACGNCGNLNSSVSRTMCRRRRDEATALDQGGGRTYFAAPQKRP